MERGEKGGKEENRGVGREGGEVGRKGLKGREGKRRKGRKGRGEEFGPPHCSRQIDAYDTQKTILLSQLEKI
jgi:hypothetical protein